MQKYPNGVESNVLNIKTLNKKNKRYNNKGPRYFEKLGHIKKKLRNFFLFESKRKHGKRFNNERK